MIHSKVAFQVDESRSSGTPTTALRIPASRMRPLCDTATAAPPTVAMEKRMTKDVSYNLKIALPIVALILLVFMLCLCCRGRYHKTREKHQQNLDREAREAQEREAQRNAASNQPGQRSNVAGAEAGPTIFRAALLQRPSNRPAPHRPMKISDIPVTLSIAAYPSPILNPPPTAPFGRPDNDSWLHDDARNKKRETNDSRQLLDVPAESSSRRPPSRVRDSYMTADYTDITVLDPASDESDHDPALMPAALAVNKKPRPSWKDGLSAMFGGTVEETPESSNAGGQLGDTGGDSSHDLTKSTLEGLGLTPSNPCQDPSQRGNDERWEDIPLQENVRHSKPPRDLPPSQTAPNVHDQPSDARSVNRNRSSTHPDLQAELAEFRRRLLLISEPSVAGKPGRDRVNTHRPPNVNGTGT